KSIDIGDSSTPAVVLPSAHHLYRLRWRRRVRLLYSARWGLEIGEKFTRSPIFDSKSESLLQVLQHECRFKVAVEFMEALGLKKQCSCVMFFNMNVR
ncbi:hypothetical protein ISN45_Aa05g003560, partial [Arabidopsis thaliana x Arabidopsis arenosa]